MKKIVLLFAAVGLFSLTACNNDDDFVYQDNDTISEVFEVENVNFTASGNYTATVPLDPVIYPADVILVYRLSGIDPQGRDIWEFVPTSYTLDEGTVKYFTDFSVNSVAIYFESDFDPMLRQDFSLNQVFRIAIVPGFFSDNLDTSDYNAVMSALQEHGVQERHIEIQ